MTVAKMWGTDGRGVFADCCDTVRSAVATPQSRQSPVRHPGHTKSPPSRAVCLVNRVDGEGPEVHHGRPSAARHKRPSRSCGSGRSRTEGQPSYSGLGAGAPNTPQGGRRRETPVAPARSLRRNVDQALQP